MSETTQIISDIGGWSLVPEWVLDLEISDRAVRLYALLGRYVNANGTCFPSRRTLAERMRCSPTSLDRAVKELEDAGALRTEERRRDDQSRTTNLYVLTYSPTTTPLVTRDEGGSRTGDEAKNENHHEGLSVEGTQDSLLTAKFARARETETALAHEPLGKVDRKPVKPAEEQLARDVLANWNVRTGQDLTANDWLRKIIMRIREHPELGLREHEAIIEETLRDPWWDGPDSPSVVYGNGALFERCLTLARNGHGPVRQRRKLRYGRGVTPAQAIEMTRGLR